MLFLYPQPIFKIRGIDNPLKYLIKNGFTYFSAKNILTSPLTIRTVHLEKICLLLRCRPDDLFYWKADADDVPDTTQPLQKLNSIADTVEIREMLMRMPLERIKQVNEMLKGGE